MSVTIGSFSTSRLTAQPFGYVETDTTAGLTAKRWAVSGLLDATEWQALLSEYNAWRDLRILDEDTISSGVVGTTVNLTANANGLTWSAVPCWFAAAPEGDQAGPYIQARCELVDAAEALAVLLKSREKEQQRTEAQEKPDLGTVTLGTAVLKLLAPMETYADTPQLQLTASGTHVISGALTATRARQIQGTTDATGWTAVQTWYETTVAGIPAIGDWYPTSAPTADAEVAIVDGVKGTKYTVSVSVAEVK